MFSKLLKSMNAQAETLRIFLTSFLETVRDEHGWKAQSRIESVHGNERQRNHLIELSRFDGSRNSNHAHRLI
jgi:hypothetical protein